MGIEPLVTLIAAPLFAALIAVVYPKQGGMLSILATLLMLFAAASSVPLIHEHGELRHHIGDWGQGLSIAIRLDALAVLFLLLNAVVGLAGSIYAGAYFNAEQGYRFWPQWLLLLTALNALLISADLFNLYVSLELIGLAAVGLTAMGHGAESLRAALRYLSVGLIASMLFLAGVVLFYLNHGTLDLALLAQSLRGDAMDQPTMADQLAIAMISVGLMMKAALFPLHFWLPSAHSSAPAPVSAVLSALVVKAAWYLMLRLWLEVFEPAISEVAVRWLAVLAAAGVLWGSWHALRAARLKLVAAYSSVAQLGYLFLAIPLLMATPEGELRQSLLAGVVVFALGHGLAKAALFLAAGMIIQKGGNDDISRLDGTVQSLPNTAFVLGLAGVALIGLPPSAAFIGKWHLLDAAIVQGQIWVVLVMLVGSLLAGAYVFRVISHAFGHSDSAGRRVPTDRRVWPPLLLASGATVILGLGTAPVWMLLGVLP